MMITKSTALLLATSFVAVACPISTADARDGGGRERSRPVERVRKPAPAPVAVVDDSQPDEHLRLQLRQLRKDDEKLRLKGDEIWLRNNDTNNFPGR